MLPTRPVLAILTAMCAGTLALPAHADTTINAGDVLILTSPASVTTGPITFAGSGVMVFADSFTLTNDVVFNGGVAATIFAKGQSGMLSGSLSGAGGLSVPGDGTLTLTGNNTFSGGTTLTAGTLALGSNAALGTGGLSFTGGTLSGVSNVTLANPIGMNGNITFAAATGTTLGVGVGGWFLEANAGLTFGAPGADGTVLWRTTGTSINSPGTQSLTVAGGTLKAGDASFNGLISKMGSVNVASGATLDLAGTSVAVPANLSGSGRITSSSGAPVFTTQGGSFGGVIDGSLGLSVESGNLTLTGSASYTGGTTIAFGQTLTFSSNADSTLSGVISGAGVLAKVGGGTQGRGRLTLTGNNTFSGGTTLSTGTLAVGSNTALGTGALTFSGGTLLGVTNAALANRVDVGGNVTFAAASGTTLDVGGGGWSLAADVALTIGAPGADGTVLFRTGSPLITPGGSKSLTVAGGTLKVGDATLRLLTNQMGSMVVASGATLDLGDFYLPAPPNLSGSGRITSSSSLAVFEATGGSFGGVIDGSLGLIVRFGDLTLTGSASYIGSTLIESPRTLTFNSSLNSTLSGVIFGTGRLVKQGAGTLTLTGNNTFTGGATLSAGTLAIGSSTALGLGQLTFSGGTLSALTNATLTNRLAMIGDITFKAAGGTTLFLNNLGGMLLANDTMLRFGDASGANGTIVWSMPGGPGSGVQRAVLAGGTLKIGEVNFGSVISRLASLVVGENSTLDLNGIDITAPVDLSGSGRITSSTGTPLLTTRGGAFSGALDGSLNLNVSSGNLILNKAANYSGNTTIASKATLRLGAGGTIGNVSNSGQLVMEGVTSFGTLTQPGDGSGAVRMLSGTFSLTGSGITSDSLVIGDRPGGGNAAFGLEAGKTLAIGAETIGNATDNNATFTQSGGTHTATSLVLGAALRSDGVFNLNGGSFSVGSVALGQGSGTFNFNGGTFNNSGDLRVTNFAVGFGAGYTGSTIDVTGALTNFGTLSASGQINVGGSLDNSGSLVLTGNTLAGSGALVNNNLLSGFGTIGGSGGFNNYGQMQISGTGLLLANTGANANYGNWDVAAGQPLVLSGAALANFGVMNLNGGLVSGSGVLNNAAGGSIVGRGTITANLSNAGVLGISGGALAISRAFANAGVIDLRGGNASLTGGAVANNGIVQGAGTVSSALANNGTVEALGGTLLLGGAVSNNVSGLMTAGAGNRLVISSGLSSNAGIIQLAGGTFDNNAHALSNTGQMSGFGTFRASAFSNLGRMNFSGGNTVINGNLTNQAGATLDIAYNPATFTGNVVNNGFIKTTATNVTWAGSFTNNGTYLSDPSTQVFQDITLGAGGALQGGVGDVFVITGNMVNNSQNRAGFDISASKLMFSSGPHNLTWGATNFGATFAGYQQNFAVGIFELANGSSLNLSGTSATPGANALYVHSLLLGGGLGQIASIQSGGLNIYYDPTDAANSYLQGATYGLAGGGSLMAVAAVPEPETYAMWLAGLLMMGGIAFRRRAAVRRA